MKQVPPIAHSFCLTSLNSQWLQRFLIIVLLFILTVTSVNAQIARRGATITAVKSVAAGTTMTLNKPTGVVAGDVMIMTYSGNGNSNYPTLAGWSVIPLNFGTPSILYKIAGASEPVSYTFTVDAVTGVGGMFAFSGVDVSYNAPFEAIGASCRWTNWSQLSTCGSINTQYDGAAVLLITSATAQVTFSGWSTTSPGALTEILDAGTTGAAIGAAWANKPTAGNTGNGLVNLSASPSAAYPILLALKRKPVIARRGTTTTVAKSVATGTTMTINKPTGVVAGDVMIMTYAGNGNSSHPVLSGWSALSIGFEKPSILYKVAGAAEPANYTFTVDPVTAIAGMFAFTDVDVSGSTPFEAIGPGCRWTNWAQLTTCGGGINTQYDGAGILLVTSATQQLTFSGWSTTSPGLLTEILDAGTTGAAIGVAWANKPTAGNTGTGAVNLSAAPAAAYPILLALKRRQFCVAPTLPVLGSTSTTNCGAQSTTLSITSGNLNSASNWQWYSGSCGGVSVGSGTSVVVTPQVTTTYYARGEGSCFVSGQCASITITVNTPVTYYVDADGDGYGSTTTASFCSPTAPAGYSANNTDCNDNNANIHAPVQYYVDADGDGYGSTATANLCSLTAPAGYSTNNTDCNDNNPNIHAPVQYYLDADGDGYGSTTTANLCSLTPPIGYSTNNTDCNDNDAEVHAGIIYYIDADGDGYGSTTTANLCSSTPPAGYSTNNTDCNDNNANIHAPVQYYIDADGDGYGSTITASICSLTPPAGYSINNSDCNDADAAINPGATEICDGKDNNCNGSIDEGFPANTYYRDADGDGYGNPEVTTTAKCSPPSGYVTDNTDCNDNNANIHAPVLYYIDADGDGYGSTTTATLCSSTAPAGYSTNNTDCNDADAAINPGATEICDGKDNNCNGSVDEGFATNTYYRDADGDGYGDPEVTTTSKCNLPAGYVTDNTDCNDNNANIHAPVQYYVDADGDGYGSATTATLCSSTAPAGYSTNNTDCNDSDAAINPGATEICDGKDNNCDGSIDEGFPTNTYYRDADGDGYGDPGITTTATCNPPAGYVTDNTDCNDADAGVHVPIRYYVDADNDGYGIVSNKSVLLCSSVAPAGYSPFNTDCNDRNAAINPAAIEICDGIDNNCNGQTDESCPQSELSINDVSIAEGNTGKKTLSFTVTLSQVSTKTVTVNYATTNGTAITPSDYAAKSGSLSFRAGTTAQQVAVTIVGDKIIEPDEVFQVILSNPTNAIINKGTGTGTILNDDGNPPTRSSVASNTENETIVQPERVVKLWPNPATNVVNLQLEGYTGNIIIQLFSPTGKILRQQRINDGKARNQLKVDLSAYSSGIYLVSITDEKGNRHSERLIVIK